ncbi:MarR family winged helix-turn-helix transcriptional regulator [Dokdonella soli]|uniref:Helix-turn-helix domain-containing protein n=1 Tax=Dokdonella soli TaxID=529810 RepID=A0ABP3TZT2_9GAMM
MKRTLGTQLRHLIDLLDAAVEAAYAEAGLDYRPRYTPVMKSLAEREPLTLGDIANLAGITQPAATQTIALMREQGLVRVTAGSADARQKLIRLTAQGQALLPQLQACWLATEHAARDLEAELRLPLSQTLESAITALSARSFGTRIRIARDALANRRGDTGAKRTRVAHKRNARPCSP